MDIISNNPILPLEPKRSCIRLEFTQIRKHLKMLNPFENTHKNLVNLSSGAFATAVIEHDMNKMLEKEKVASASFLGTRIIGETNVYYFDLWERR